MPENELMPKGNTSKEWLDYADSKLKQFKDYHSETNLIGQIKHPQPLGDDYSRLLSDHEVQARSKGMSLLRKETAANKMARNAPSYKHGGKVRKTGLAYVHKGETVVPAGGRKTKRKQNRSSGRY